MNCAIRQVDKMETTTGCQVPLSACLCHLVPTCEFAGISIFNVLLMHVIYIQVYHTISGGQEEWNKTVYSVFANSQNPEYLIQNVMKLNKARKYI